jgi:S1-C subfamily serine protease
VEPIVRDFQRRFRYTGQRAMLGVNIEDTERGARIAGVSPGGPAADAGLKVGDTIISMDGADLAAPRSAAGASQSPTELLLAAMGNVDPGDSVKLRVLAEGGAERDVTIQARQITPEAFVHLPNFTVLPKGGQSLLSFNAPGSFVFFGGNAWSDMQLVTLTPELGAYFGTQKGLLVVRGPGTDTLRLQDGDVILDIGGREPTTPEHALRILASFQAGETLKISIMRKQRRETLEFKVPDEQASRG